MKTKTQITAHAGCEDSGSRLYHSVRIATACADCAEVDVRIAPDGTLVLSHDRQENYGTFPYTLEQVFSLFRETGLSFNCDLKEPAALYPVLALADRCGIGEGRLIFSGSVSCDLLAAEPAIARRARIYLNIEEILKHLVLADVPAPAATFVQPWRDLTPRFPSLMDAHLEKVADLALSLGAAALNVPFAAMRPEWIAAFRSRGLPLSFWTVNREDDLLRLLAEHPANITTLRPRLAAQLREQLSS